MAATSRIDLLQKIADELETAINNLNDADYDLSEAQEDKLDRFGAAFEAIITAIEELSALDN